ncbi:MAG: GNAT family N-acetyltransferase, partial [Tepidisphaeraceae bacterium]
MAVFSRQRDETVIIGDAVEVTVVEIRKESVLLRVEAPPELSVLRKESYDARRPAGQPLPSRADINELSRARTTQPGASPKKQAPDVQIRLATESDLPVINDIYNYYVPRSTCTYQEEPETIDARRMWFIQHHSDPRQPVTVAEIDGNIVGWGSLSDYRERSGYRFTCENSVYVDHEFHNRGIGSAILADLIERARRLDYHTIIAGADAEQTASIA